MTLEKLFQRLENCEIMEETLTKDGSLALPSVTYTFLKAQEKGHRVGSVLCSINNGGDLEKREFSAITLLDLAKDGIAVYQYEDIGLALTRILGGVAKWGETNTFTKRLRKTLRIND